MTIIDYFVLIYVTGFIISAIKSLYFSSMLTFNSEPVMQNLLNKMPRLKYYIIIKPFFWPFFFVTEKSSLERLSELFFKNYGEKNHTYLRSQGLKNFFNDIYYGKNRYRGLEVKKVFWTIDKNNQKFKNYQKLFRNDKTTIIATIIFAEYKNKFLLSASFASKEITDFDNKIVSRFQLDRCEKLDKQQLKERLLDINPEQTNELLKAINI